MTVPFEQVLTETHGAVGVIRLNRPAIRNALSLAMIGDLASAVDLMGRDPRLAPSWSLATLRHLPQVATSKSS
jgi:enoyl-CoA hydratase/carnithine racemase